MSEEYVRFASEAIFAALEESLETAQIMVNFRIFLMELRERIASGEVSTERARELVRAKKASAFDKIHRSVILSAKKTK